MPVCPSTNVRCKHSPGYKNNTLVIKFCQNIELLENVPNRSKDTPTISPKLTTPLCLKRNKISQKTRLQIKLRPPLLFVLFPRNTYANMQQQHICEYSKLWKFSVCLFSVLLRLPAMGIKD